MKNASNDDGEVTVPRPFVVAALLLLASLLAPSVNAISSPPVPPSDAQGCANLLPPDLDPEGCREIAHNTVRALGGPYLAHLVIDFVFNRLAPLWPFTSCVLGGGNPLTC